MRRDVMQVGLFGPLTDGLGLDTRVTSPFVEDGYPDKEVGAGLVLEVMLAGSVMLCRDHSSAVAPQVRIASVPGTCSIVVPPWPAVPTRCSLRP